MSPKQTVESLYDAYLRGDIPFIIGLTSYESYIDSAVVTAALSEVGQAVA